MYTMTLNNAQKYELLGVLEFVGWFWFGLGGGG
jgi:hypothetical protein